MSSIICGILASVLPNLIFSWFCNSFKAKAPKQFIKFFYLSEGLKFACSALLVSAILQWPSLQVIEFISAFVLSEVGRLFYQFFKAARTTT